MSEPKWNEPTYDMPDGWYWCEELESDQPPQLLRFLGIRVWHRWTISGWARLKGRVAPCSGRPE
jgi:hypothetical protein